ncbi:MAG: long-chain fatty acid transporter [Hydrogenophilales bacterium 12-61-10]|nr:outer membrane protein transport protein [Gammaproteobacteria bacterium]OYW36709.1 MAG: long-chain fatty acid transporter [Hydrogenophilales bacterium 12-61-10]
MKFTRVFAFMALAGLAGSAYATNGYFSHGYGMKAMGMGGAATASSDDAFGGANNPASMAFAGDRIDLGASLFNPNRSASRTGLGPLDMSVDSDSEYFVMPEFGMTKQMSSQLALGVTVYGNGGMNSDYAGGQIAAGVCGPGAPASNMLCGQGDLGVDLMQLVVAPTIAYKVAPNHSIGISPLIGYQMFEAKGLQAFSGNSSAPTQLTNNGHDSAWGFGVRIGYMGQITPTVTIGAAYASKMKFEEFDEYAGLFAEQGGFDIPENYSLGVAWQATPAFKLALDYQRISYSDVNSIANQSLVPFPLGADNGPGFGWQDIDVWKLGAEYKYSQQLTLRAGWNHGDNPITPANVTFNILAPGVIEDHLTLGFTYTLASGNELTMSYMHAFSNDVSGASILPVMASGGTQPPSGTETIEMDQNLLGIQYSWKM